MPSLKFSANLGYLWKDLSLAAAIRAAHAAGFDAVECHWPYDAPVSDVRAALSDTGLPMLGINTRRGGPSELGLAALPDRMSEARAAIDEAIDYAEAIGAKSIHVTSGFSAGPEARKALVANLDYAARRTDRMLLIEPLNRHDAPGYFLSSTDQAADIIREMGISSIKLMFDIYHVGRSEGDVLTRLSDLLPIIGHIQFAAVPDRGPPDHGELHFPTIFEGIRALGWARPLGAEYRTEGATEASLGWMKGVKGT